MNQASSREAITPITDPVLMSGLEKESNKALTEMRSMNEMKMQNDDIKPE